MDRNELFERLRDIFKEAIEILDSLENIRIIEDNNMTSHEPLNEEEIYPLGEWENFIPDDINDTETFFMEMAEIYPKYNKEHNIKNNRFKVGVMQGGEGPVPHVHVFYGQKNSKKDVAYICLGKAKYAPQHIKETKVLNSEERKALQEFFETTLIIKNRKGNDVETTCWDEAVDTWMRTYDTDPEKYFEIDEETGLYIMPNYLELEK